MKNKQLKKGIFHLVLIAGALVFSLPFLWLISSSCKSPDEMYPPKWIPQVPDAVTQSPYMALLPNEYAQKPVAVDAADWQRVQGPVRDSLAKRLDELSPQLPEFMTEYLDSPIWVEAIFAALVLRAPDTVFSGDANEAAAWFVNKADIELATTAFERVYRRLALADVTVYGRDASFEEVLLESGTDAGSAQRTTGLSLTPWHVAAGPATPVPRFSGLRRSGIEMHYDFTQQDEFSAIVQVPYTMSTDNLGRFAAAVHCDRSWHSVDAIVELDGKRYESVQTAYLGLDKWQDFVYRLPGGYVDPMAIRTWRDLKEVGESDWNTPKVARLTLTFKKASPVMAAANKYLSAYRDVLRMAPLGVYVKNSVLLVILNIAGQVFSASLVAYAFARLRWPGRDACFLLVLATLMIPPQVTMIPVFLIYKNIGWHNTLQPLWVGSLFGGAFYIFLLRQFMLGIPRDLEDSARIDGCSRFGIYRLIVLPLIKPALASIGIFTFLATWNDFMGPLIYLNDQRLYPLSLGLFALQVFNQANIGLMMAAAVLMTVPVILLFFAAQRHFIQGVTLTGLKG